jgi:hypothetical protein
LLDYALYSRTRKIGHSILSSHLRLPRYSCAQTDLAKNAIRDKLLKTQRVN